MVIEKSEKLNGSPDLIYKNGLKFLTQQNGELYNIIKWDDAKRTGQIDHKGLKAEFSITDLSYLKIHASIGFPASLKSGGINKYIDEVCTKMKEIYP